jgi:hypothetical protein
MPAPIGNRNAVKPAKKIRIRQPHVKGLKNHTKNVKAHKARAPKLSKSTKKELTQALQRLASSNPWSVVVTSTNPANN